MKLKLISFCLFICTFCSYGQGMWRCFNNLFLDRPLTKCDSENIIKNHIKCVKVYGRLVDDSLPNHVFVGKWIVTIENNKLKSTTWVGDTSGFLGWEPVLKCTPGIVKKYSKKEIVEAKESYSEVYEFTHSIDKFGRIYQTKMTKIKLKSSQPAVRMEDGWIYSKIEYKYDVDFLVESDYFTDGLMDERYEPWVRLYFEYEH